MLRVLAAAGRVAQLLLAIFVFDSAAESHKAGEVGTPLVCALVVLMAVATAVGVLVPLGLFFRPRTVRTLSATAVLDFVSAVLVACDVGLVLAYYSDNCGDRPCHRVNALIGLTIAFVVCAVLFLFANALSIDRLRKRAEASRQNLEIDLEDGSRAPAWSQTPPTDSGTKSDL